jgi:hypothetical protein
MWIDQCVFKSVQEEMLMSNTDAAESPIGLTLPLCYPLYVITKTLTITAQVSLKPVAHIPLETDLIAPPKCMRSYQTTENLRK